MVAKKEEPFTVDAELSGVDEITVTIKQTSTTGSPWFIWKGTVDEWIALDIETLKASLEKVHKATEFFQGLLPEQPAEQRSGGAPQGARDEPFPGPAKQCKHGEMQKRTGVKNGRTWKAYFCPTEKGTSDQCSPEFVKG